MTRSMVPYPLLISWRQASSLLFTVSKFGMATISRTVLAYLVKNKFLEVTALIGKHTYLSRSGLIAFKQTYADPKEAAELFAVSEDYFKKMIRNGCFFEEQLIRLGKKYIFINRQFLSAWREAHI